MGHGGHPRARLPLAGGDVVPQVVSLAEARARLLASLPQAPTGSEVVSLTAAAGRVLAADARTSGDLPPFDRSLVDGFAVRSTDGGDLAPGEPVVMGRVAPPLSPGSASPVPTGGMVPAGADAVVMQEDVRRDGGRVRLLCPGRPGDNLVRRGSDARAGDVAVPAGRRLRPAEIAWLATIGILEVPVRQRPRIAVLSTGDELVAAGQPVAPGQVRDSNAPALCAALERDGATPVPLGVVGDQRAAISAALRRGLRCDVLLCTGGSSVGERDYVQVELAQVMGVPPLFSGIAIRPGRPTAAFVAGGRLAVALPGHAVSALVVYELLLREAVRRLGGEVAPAPRGAVFTTLTAGLAAPADRDLYARVRLEQGQAVPLAGPSATVGHLARADALVRCAAGHQLAAGEAVAALLLD